MSERYFATRACGVGSSSEVEGKTGELQFDFADFGQEDLPYIDAATMTLRDDMLENKKTDVLVGRNDVPWSGALPASKEQQALAYNGAGDRVFEEVDIDKSFMRGAADIWFIRPSACPPACW